MRFVVTILVLFVFELISMPLAGISSLLALVVFSALTISFVWEGLKNIPANPPHEAVLTFCGRRLKVVLKEGLNFLPLYPLFSFILVKVEKVNQDFDPHEVRTPDRARIEVGAGSTWRPGIRDSSGETTPESLINFLNAGGEVGVRKILGAVVEDRTKTWALSNREGPSTWKEAQALKDDVHQVLVKSLLSETLPTIGGDLPEEIKNIPTNTWMRFFDRPQSKPTVYDCDGHGRPNQVAWAWMSEDESDWNWNGLEGILNPFSNEVKAQLKAEIKQRGEDVKRLRDDQGDFPKHDLGITIQRFSVGDIKVLGKVADAAEKEEEQRRQREADAMELQNVSERIADLRKKHRKMTLKQAIRLVQIEKGKISQSVFEVIGAQTGLGQDILAGVGLNRQPAAAGQGGQTGP